MALSEAQKKKIEEEETYRAEVRGDVKKKKDTGCLTVIFIFVVLVIIGSIYSAFSPQSSKPVSRETFKASVNFTGTQFIINNLDDLDCENAKMDINGGILSKGYSLEGFRLEAGTTYTVGAGQFTKSDGTRFNPFEVKPKTFNIYCSQIGSTNALRGASWYGEFN